MTDTAPATIPRSSPEAPRLIIEAVGRRYGFSYDYLTDPDEMSRGAYMDAKRAAVALVRHLTDMSYPRLAELFGWIDHTSARHHCQTFGRLIADDPEAARFAEAVIQEVGPRLTDDVPASNGRGNPPRASLPRPLPPPVASYRIPGSVEPGVLVVFHEGGYVSWEAVE